MREALAALAAALAAAAAPAAAGAGLGDARRAELEHLLRHDCGACHGMRLTGGLGPPLTPEALAGKPATALERAVLDGRPGTPMPPWRGLLTAEETRWLVERLRAGAPDPR